MSNERQVWGRLLAVGGALLLLWGAGVRLPAAHPDDPKIKAAIGRGVTYLKAKAALQFGGYDALCAYALLKSKVPASDPAIQKVVAKLVKKVNAAGEYDAAEHQVYEAGVDLMALEAADRVKYKPQIEAITKYLLGKQLKSGSWDYPGGANNGDTSITQYALLGLWAAERAGVKVPTDVWNRASQWYLKFQLKGGDVNGAFSYHPAFTVSGDFDRNASHSMTAAGAGSLMVARLHLYPNAKGLGGPRPNNAKKKAAGNRGPKFGVLESINFDKIEDAKKKGAPKPVKPEPEGPRVAIGTIDGAVGLSAGWLSRYWTVVRVKGLQKWPLYYLYALERMCALAELEKVGDHDWYAEGSAHLVAAQMSDGSWMGRGAAVGATTGTPAGTAFALLFLTKSTARMLNRRLGTPDALGAGLQAGGRGLSADLSLVEAKGGKIEAKKILLPIDKLLAELENPKTLSIQDAQKAIVETVQIGDREKLIGQKDRLKVLAKHPDGEIRRTAFWALGRCEDLTVVPLLLKGLNDDDLAVVIEARNALCALTRKPRGIFVNGKPLPSNPNIGLPDTATADQKKAAVADWQRKVQANWIRWHYRYRPYINRDDLEELKFTTP